MTVPIAAQATSCHLLHVIRNTSLTILVIDASHLDFALHLLEGSTVKHIIVLGHEVQPQSNDFGIHVYTFDHLKQLGLQFPIETSDHLGKRKSVIISSIFHSYLFFYIYV